MEPEVNNYQYEQMMLALNETTSTLHRIRESLDQGLGAIRDQLIEGFAPEPNLIPQMSPTYDLDALKRGFTDAAGHMIDIVHTPGQVTVNVPKGSGLALARSEALQAVLDALDGWIEGARSNHAGWEHRDEPVGSECWRQFTPADIRTMINDAAREVGLEEFPKPVAPMENRP